MNYVEIEKLKLTLTNLMKQACRLKIPEYGIDGRIMGVGFKPYWTNPADSKIEKIEFNIMDKYGRLKPVNFFNITGYKVLSHDACKLESSQNISFDIHIYSPLRIREKEPFDKIQLDIVSLNNN